MTARSEDRVYCVGGCGDEPTSPFCGLRVRAEPAFANRHVFARNDKEIVCASLAAGQ